MNKIKILYVVDNLAVGGVTEVVKNTINKHDSKYTVKLISLSDNISGWDNDLCIELIVFKSQVKYNYRLRDYFIETFISDKIYKDYNNVIDFIVKEKPDIIHFHTLPRFLKIGLIVKKQIKVKLVYTDHLVRISPNDYNTIIRHILGFIYRKMYRQYNLIFVSKEVQDVAKKHKFISRNKKYTKIDNGIDLNKYKSKPKKNKEPIIFIYIARISPVKGHLDLINAWKKINSDIKRELWIVGPNEIGDSINKIKGSCETIKIIGTVKDIPNILRKVDVGVFPSYKEGLPLSLLEKMASGLPVIVSNINELTYVIENNVNGLVFKLGDIDDLTTKMGLLLNNFDLRLSLGNNAITTVKQRFSIEMVIEKMNKFYTEILNI